MGLQLLLSVAVAAVALSCSARAASAAARLQPAEDSSPKDTFDCAMRHEALALTAELQPFRTQAELQLVADALAGAPEVPAQCRNLSAAAAAGTSRDAAAAVACPAGARTLYVSSVNGSDSGPGTLQRPLLTVGAGVAALRAGSAGGRRCLLLRGGVFFLPETLVLGAADSGLTIAAMPGERAVLSGGQPLVGGAWAPHRVSAADWRASNVWAAKVSTAAVEALRTSGGHVHPTKPRLACSLLKCHRSIPDHAIAVVGARLNKRPVGHGRKKGAIILLNTFLAGGVRSERCTRTTCPSWASGRSCARTAGSSSPRRRRT